MKPYDKINTVWKRDAHGNILNGEWAHPAFEYLASVEWRWTEKVDGTNIRVMWNEMERAVRFGGKTDNAQIHQGLLARLQDLFPVEKMVAAFYDCSSACLYGEGYGAKIQKGGGNYKPDGQDFVLFDVKVGEWWLQWDDVLKVAEALGIDVVPTVGAGSILFGVDLVSDGDFTSAWGDFMAEGLVMRPMVDLLDRRGKRILAKIKAKDFAERKEPT